jgi:hypothetical protein
LPPARPHATYEGEEKGRGEKRREDEELEKALSSRGCLPFLVVMISPHSSRTCTGGGRIICT